MSQPDCDVAVIGSGLAGSALACCLARAGLSVEVFEAGEHPRFAIGESMILETSETLRAMARLFDVPELARLTAEPYLGRLGSSHGVKRHFGFLHHGADGAHDPADRHQSLQAVIPDELHGHELHLFRQDADAMLAAAAVRYGARLHQRTPVAGVDLDGDGATLHTPSGAVRARYVVDAGGRRSPLAEALGLRTVDGAETHSRALFTHMIGVGSVHDAPGASRRDYGVPFAWDEGTLHHVFPGGWMWVIPFGNHAGSTNPLTSVGLVLDPAVHPEPEGLSPGEEFRAFVARYPAVAAQFEGALAVRPWVRAPRVQHGSRDVSGRRWCLLGHAAGFVDPLFSKGLYASTAAASLVAHRLVLAHETDDWDGVDAGGAVGRQARGFLRSNDRLVARSFRAFETAELWAAFSVVWLLGAHLELLALFAARAEATGADGRIDRGAYFERTAGLRMVGGGFGGFDRLEAEAYAVLDGSGTAAGRAARLRTLLAEPEWVPHEFRSVLAGGNHLARRKVSLAVLRQPGGPLGRGSYRRHFFGDRSGLRVAGFLAREWATYRRPALGTLP